MEVFLAIQIHKPHRAPTDTASVQGKDISAAVAAFKCGPVAKDDFVIGAALIVVCKPGPVGQVSFNC